MMEAIGPGANPHATLKGFNIIKQFGDGSMKTGAPRVGFGILQDYMKICKGKG